MLEMVLNPDASTSTDSKDNGVIEGLRLLSQTLFKDTETMVVDADLVYKALDKYLPQSKEEIMTKLQKIERGGKIGRTKLDDLIDNLEEVIYI